MHRASSDEPGFQDLGYLPLTSMCSYERVGWFGSPDLARGFSNQDFGNRAKISHLNPKRNWSRQPGSFEEAT